MRWLTGMLLVCPLLNAVLLDRVAVTVGSRVITELQIDEDLRVAALLNNKPVVRDNEARRSAADRLVDQLLIQHEIEISHYPGPADEQLQTLYASVVQTLGGASALAALLDEYHVSEQTLRGHLRAQLATLEFIEFRFRPDVNVTDTEVEQAYQHQIAARTAGAGELVPPLDAGERARLSQVLIEERTDAALNRWLAETRKQFIIRYVDSTLR